MAIEYDQIQPGEVEDYIDRKGWDIQKRERSELILKVCPLCGKTPKARSDRNFYINKDSGLWHTYCCDRKGNLFTLKKEMGDLDLAAPSFAGYGTKEAAMLTERIKKARGKTWDGYNLPRPDSETRYANRLWSGEAPGALDYLQQDRCLSEATLREFGFGVARRGKCPQCEETTSLGDGDVCPVCRCVVPNAREMIAIPHRVDGRVVNFKFRTFGSAEKFYGRWTDAPTVLFNADSLDGEFKQVILTEGEIDAVTISQLGYKQVVSTGSAQKRLDDDWVEKLALFDDVLIAYDADGAGDEGATKVAEALGRYRCKRVLFPLKDVNDCLRAGITTEEIRACIDGAASYQVNAVKPFSAYADDLRELKRNGRVIFGRQTKWRGVNSIMGGLRDGEVTVVTGDTGSGKTTWTTAVAWDQARGDGAERPPVGVLIASFEMPIRDTCRKLVCMESGSGFREVSEAELESAILTLSKLKLFFVDQYGTMPIADLRDAIEYGVRRHGLWLIVIDHLHFFLDCKPEEERFHIDQTCRTLKAWALKLGIHIMLVVHPAKLRVANGKEQKVELNDLKGSSEIKKAADSVVRVWRPRGDDRNKDVPPFAEIATLKMRSEFGREDETVLSFDPDSLRYEYDPQSTEQAKKDAREKKKKRSKKKKADPAQAEPQQETDQPQGAMFDDDDEPKPRTLHIGGSPAQQSRETFTLHGKTYAVEGAKDGK